MNMNMNMNMRGVGQILVPQATVLDNTREPFTFRLLGVWSLATSRADLKYIKHSPSPTALVPMYSGITRWLISTMDGGEGLDDTQEGKLVT